MNKHWTSIELDYLERMAGNVPRQALLKAYNCWAGSAGKPLRTSGAIKHRLNILGVSAKAEGDMITSGVISGILGANPSTVQGWFDIPDPLPACRCGAWRYIRRRDLVAFAKRRPDLFCRFPVSRLVALLENRALAEAIAKSGIRPRGIPRRVVAIEAGLVYPSSRAAAKASGIHHTILGRYIRNGLPVGGYHWRWYDSQATPPQTNG